MITQYVAAACCNELIGLSVPASVANIPTSAGEAIAAATSTAAELLGLGGLGRIALSFRADLLLVRHRDERLLGFEFDGNPVDWSSARVAWRMHGRMRRIEGPRF